VYDRGDKFERYRTWSKTLSDYVLVSQTKPHVEHFHRKTDGGWEMQDAIGLAATVALPSIGCTLNLADVYDRITFPEAPGELT
jgi:Uma2 family endonuclease